MLLLVHFKLPLSHKLLVTNITLELSSPGMVRYVEQEGALRQVHRPADITQPLLVVGALTEVTVSLEALEAVELTPALRALIEPVFVIGGYA